jgi:hypothetical protein
MCILRERKPAPSSDPEIRRDLRAIQTRGENSYTFISANWRPFVVEVGAASHRCAGNRFVRNCYVIWVIRGS